MTDLSEKDFQRQVTDLAEILGWSWVHFRPARTNRGWRTPVMGPLGAGWPDVFLAHPGRGLLAVEVKRDKAADPTPAQLAVHDWLRRSGLEVIVARPSDLDFLMEALRGESHRAIR